MKFKNQNLIIFLVLLFNFGNVYSQSSNYVKALLNSPTDYGIVIGDKAGIINSATLNSNSSLLINYQIEGNEQTLNGNYNAATYLWESTKSGQLVFNKDGTAKGKSIDNEGFYILIGEKSNDHEVISDLTKKGLRGMSMDLVMKNRLPGHDAPTWYYHQSADYLQISFVFPVGFVHPAHGPQAHVRVFEYNKINNKWTVKEDNTSILID